MNTAQASSLATTGESLPGNQPIDLVLSRLPGFKKSGSQFLARCPAHNDGTASLSVGIGDNGTVLLKCFAGCSYEAVLGAIQLDKRELFPRSKRVGWSARPATSRLTLEALARDKGMEVDFLQAQGLINLDTGGVSIPYLDREAKPIAVKKRTALVAREGSYWPKGQSLAAYGQWRLGEARKARFLVLVEGESDCWTLWYHGFPALGVPGSSATQVINVELLEGIETLYMVQEPDAGGVAFVDNLQRRLANIQWRGRAFVLQLGGTKDPNALHKRQPETFNVVFQAAMEIAEPLSFQISVPDAPTPAATRSPADDVHLTDLGNARRLIGRHGPDLRYSYNWGTWLVWDGTHWQRDETGEIIRKGKETVTSLYGEAARLEDEDSRKGLVKHGLRSEAEARIRAMITLAESEPQVPVLTHQLDADPWLFNCLNGTIDLRTGELRPHRREDLCTKMAPVRYDPRTDCPHWLAFLDQILDGNTELRSFLQRAIGYTLTGDTREQCLFLLYGTGANGKSTLLDILRYLLGGYAVQADFSTFLAKQEEAVRNDVARLIGARFVSAIEAGDGRHLAEVLVKQLTGGDTITARFLYREYFEFKPQFKIFLAVNHKPIIRGTDYAIWRRIRLIPFTVTIPEEKQDRTLIAKLREELPGILRWAVEGSLLWLRDGLQAPEPVQQATAAYRTEMDVMAGFLTDCCVQTEDARVTPSDLYATYGAWCERNGEKPMTQRALGTRLAERGFVPARTGYARYWQGVGLLATHA